MCLQCVHVCVSRVHVWEFCMFLECLCVNSLCLLCGMCVSSGCVCLPVGHVCGMCEFCVCMCGVSASEFCVSVVRVCHQGVCVRPMYVSARL